MKKTPAKGRASGKAEPKFEKDLEQLDKIVEELEEGGLPLDQSLKKFEEGIKLAQRCEGALSAAEKKIEILTKNAAGKFETEVFGDVDEEEGGEEEDDEESEDDPDSMLF